MDDMATVDATSNALQVHCGDALEVLRTLPDGCARACITSPPYFSQRIYLPENHPDKSKEIGCGQTVSEYIAKLVEVFREVYRVLKDDGQVWIVINDSYASDPGNGRGQPERCTLQNGGSNPHRSGSNKLRNGVPRKSLMLIPQRLAIALSDDGWIIRCDPIWNKSNGLVESVKDRPTRTHEYVFMMSKAGNYYHDQEAVREPYRSAPNCLRPSTLDTGDSRKGTGYPTPHNGKVGRPGSHATPADYAHGGRNWRSVFTVPVQPLDEPHFAAYPEKLIKPFILFSSRPGDVILDPFAGSGSTLKCALELGRRAVGIELFDAYLEIIKRRCNVTPGML